MKENVKKKLVGHVERKGDEQLAKRSDAEEVEGKRRRGRPRMRWEDCVKGDLERVGGEWRTTGKDRSWRLLIEDIVRKEKMKKKTM